MLWLEFWSILFCLHIVRSIDDFEECNFEVDRCGWTQTERSDDWHRLYGENDPTDTGPSDGHTSPDKTDYYLTIDRSQSATWFQLQSPDLHNDGGDCCFRLWYHMFGANIGDLTVAVDKIEESPLLTVNGDQGDEWHCALIDINQPFLFVLNITATKGGGILNEIALDDFAFFSTSACKPEFCDISPENYRTGTSTTSTKYTTDFETTSSGIKQTMATEPPDKLLSYLPYLIAIPVGLIVLGLLAVCIYNRRLKKKQSEEKKRRMERDLERRRTLQDNPYETTQEPEPEVYDEIPADKMYSDAELAARNAQKGDAGYIDVIPENESRDNVRNEQSDKGYISPSSLSNRRTYGPGYAGSDFNNPAFMSGESGSGSGVNSQYIHTNHGWGYY